MATGPTHSQATGRIWVGMASSCGVCGTEDPAQHIGGHRTAGELAPDVASTVHDIIKAAQVHPHGLASAS
jgi:hypothetical protein